MLWGVVVLGSCWPCYRWWTRRCWRPGRSWDRGRRCWRYRPACSGAGDQTLRAGTWGTLRGESLGTFQQQRPTSVFWTRWSESLVLRYAGRRKSRYWDKFDQVADHLTEHVHVLPPDVRVVVGEVSGHLTAVETSTEEGHRVENHRQGAVSKLK